MNVKTLSTLVIILGIFQTIPLLAQNSLVTVPVVVRDRDGHSMTGLDKDDFQLLDKGKPVEISSFSTNAAPDAAVRSTAWVVGDMSIADLGVFTRLRSAAIRQVANLEHGERVALFTTSCRVLVDFTDDRTKLQEALLRLEFQPASACAASASPIPRFALLSSVARRIANQPAPRRIVFMSSGTSLSGDTVRDESDVIEAALRSRVAIDSLDVTPTKSTLFSELSYGTGGRHITPGADFDAAFRELATPSTSYVIGFVPGQPAEGGFHSLRVKLKDGRKVDVQARSGYFPRNATGAGAAPVEMKPPTRELLADAIQDPADGAKPSGTRAAQSVPRTSPVGTAILAASSPDETASTAEVTSRDEPIAFHAQTNLELLAVTVRDPQGIAVGTLRKEDFLLTDNGKRQDILRFTVQKTASAARSWRFVAYLFDDTHMTLDELQQATETARRQIAALPAQDRVGIFTTSGTNAPMDFITDRAKAESALHDIRPSPTDSRLSLLVTADLVRRMSALPGRRSIVLISPGFDVSESQRLDHAHLVIQAVHARVVISTITTGPNSEELTSLAEATGGVPANEATDNSFKKAATLPECIYTLGFAPERAKPDGSFHELKVTVKNPAGLTVQARRGYYAPMRNSNSVEASKQEIENAVFSRDEMHGVPVDLKTEFLRARDQAKLTVQAVLDVHQIHFRKVDGRNSGDITVVSSLFDTNGDFIAGAQKAVQFRLRDETRKKMEAGPPVTIRTVFNLKPGNYMVRLVVRDAEAHQITARTNPVEIQ